MVYSKIDIYFIYGVTIFCFLDILNLAMITAPKKSLKFYSADVMHANS